MAHEPGNTELRDHFDITATVFVTGQISVYIFHSPTSTDLVDAIAEPHGEIPKCPDSH